MHEPVHARESSVMIPGIVAERGIPTTGTQTLQEAERSCAYNLTRGRFISTGIESGDFPVLVLSERLPLITPGSNAGLWIVPFRGISAMSVQVPIDLIFLDEKCTVTDVVELFPISFTLPSRDCAASVLAVPAQTVTTTQTRRGDRLMFCAPPEIAQRLLENPVLGTGANRCEGIRSEREPSNLKPAGKLLPWVDRSARSLAVEAPLSQPAPTSPGIALEPGSASAARNSRKTSKNWLQKWLNPDPPDPRKAPRQMSPWLSAYFFAGGAPKAHGVRNISATGVFILTEERWYLGTIVRITLTDRRIPAAARSITVNAKAVRWGNEGVGLRFIFEEDKKTRGGTVMEGATRQELETFLRPDAE